MNLTNELIAIFTVSLGLWMVGYTWRRRYIPGALPLAGVALIAVIRTLIEMMRYHMPDIASQWWLLHVGQAITIVAPLLWILMVVEFTRRTKDTPGWIYLLFAVDFLLFQLLLWSNESHGLLLSYHLREVGDLMLLELEAGPLRRLHMGWRFLLMLATVGLLLKMAFTTAELHRRQAALILMATIPLWVSVVLQKLGLVPIEVTPLALMFSCLILTAAVTRFQLFEIMPVARDMLLDKMMDGVLVLDADQQVVEINPVAQSYLATSRTSLLGKSLQTAFVQQLDWQWQAGQSDLPRVLELELKVGGGGGEEDATLRSLEINLIPLIDPRRQLLLGWLLVLHDISDHKKILLERRLHTKAVEQAREKLQQLDSMKTHFFTNVAHEFRTPLTLTMGPIDDLLQSTDSGLSAQARQSLQLALRNNKRLLHLINELLDLAKLEAGATQLQVSRQDLSTFMPRVMAHFESLAAQHDIQLSINIDLSNPIACFDAHKLEQVMSNLLANACKFTPAGGAVDVELTGDDQWVMIRVQDSGHGIDLEELPYVFDRFYQAEVQAAAKSGQGTGVGLTLVRELVQLHGGSIGVNSAPGEGACFAIRLPRDALQDDALPAHALQTHTLLLDDEPDVAAIDTAHNASPETHDDGMDSLDACSQANIVVLLVEDNADMRLYIRSHLGTEYRLLEAADGAEGLALAREAIPDLIISDLMMPEMNGLQLCQALKADANTDHIPVIMLTAKADVDSRLEGLEAGADDYVTKPFVVRELKTRIANLLRSRQLLQQHYTMAEQPGISPDQVITPSEKQNMFLQSLQQVIEQHLSDDAFQVSDLAASVAMGERHLQRKLRALTGETPNGLIRRYRLQCAAQMLQAGSTTSQVCFAVGFSNASYFARCFKQLYGCTPSEYPFK